jgi:hypothetical protein
VLLVDAWHHITSVPKALIREPFEWVCCLHRPDLARDFLGRCRARNHLVEDIIRVEARSNANGAFGADWSSNPIESVVHAAARGTIKIGRTLRVEARLLFDLDNPDAAPHGAVVFANPSVAKRWVKAAAADLRSARVLRDATAHPLAARVAPGLWGPRPNPTRPAAEPESVDASRLAQALFAGELLLLPVGISSLLYRAAWRRSSAGTLHAASTSMEQAPIVAAPGRSPSVGQGSKSIRRFASKLPEPTPGREQACACLRQGASFSVVFVRL